MGLRHRNHRVSYILAAVILATLFVTGCVPTPAAAPPIAVPPPLITFREEPSSATLCQAATQIHLSPQLTGVWPEGASEARVIATTKFQIFPPILPTMLDLAFSAPIPAGSESASYAMRAFPGTFAALGVIFLKEEGEMTIDDILYSLDVGGLDLTPFDVAENTTESDKNFDIIF